MTPREALKLVALVVAALAIAIGVDAMALYAGAML